MKKLIYLASFITAFYIVSCAVNDNDVKETLGLVVEVTLDNNETFYGIIDESDRNLDPINLAPEYQKDSIRISFTFRARKDVENVHGWGNMIEIIHIYSLEPDF